MQAFAPASPAFDKVCDILQAHTDNMANCHKVNHKHILRLASLIVLVAPDPISVAQSPPVVRTMLCGYQEAVKFGNFRLNCKTLKWEEVHNPIWNL
jgi:hypothetical protein